MVSVAQHALALSPDDPRRARPLLGARCADYLFNHLFIEALHTGALRVPGLFWERLPFAAHARLHRRQLLHARLRAELGLQPAGMVGDARGAATTSQQRGKRNDLGWEVYPEGLAQFLREFSRYKLPHPDHRERHPDAQRRRPLGVPLHAPVAGGARDRRRRDRWSATCTGRCSTTTSGPTATVPASG